MNTQTDCFGLVWENPMHLHEAVRRSVKFERNAAEALSNIPIEVSTANTLEISGKTSMINQTSDAYIILQTLCRAAQGYRSVIVLHKGEPVARWTNALKPQTSLDLVIDGRDVANSVYLAKSFEFNAMVTFINTACLVLVLLMFVHVAARTTTV